MKQVTVITGALLAAAVAFGAENTLTDKEKAEGWKLLWDGATTEGWRSMKGPDFPEKGWEIKDGELSVIPGGGGGDIITTATYSDFIFVTDFKLTKRANSGVKYFIDPDVNGGTAPEFQLLDHDHPDMAPDADGVKKVGALYSVFPAPGAEAELKPAGEWNTLMLVCKGKRVEHWLNGKNVLTYERGSEAYRAAVATSNFKKYKGWGEAEAGHIQLQDHRSRVWFKNVKLKAL
ncbi:MAG: DUF1080 domain-containing protein [Kiritimatiellaeota bacterium]|nr:DUF1080 domain-containing protein [Kiritimatiellota bacterium]